MATTWLKPLHVNKGKSIAQTLADRVNYAENPDKTADRKLVIGYECEPRTADEEFLLAKKEYEYITGRNQGRHNILAYHIRQAFDPGEITPDEAQKVGYELAMRFTKGKHAFVVAVHIDKAHVHCHVVFNSTTLDCTHKFDNYRDSSFVVRRLSDLICAEHGLSVIKDPKPSPGRNYGSWLGDKKSPSHKAVLKQKIDEIVPSCTTFEEFLKTLKSDGFTVNDKRKHITVTAPGWGKPSRFDTLKGNYTEAAIRERLGSVKIITASGDSGTQSRFNLLVDIQSKIQEGKGAGYEQWAKIFNLKQAAKTLIFLQEQGIDSYEDLVKKSSSSSGVFSALNKRIKDAETRMKEISDLQKQIGTYGKTKDVYAKYKASGWDRNFYEEYAADIILHRAAKKYFDGLGLKKLPKMTDLKQEYVTLAAEKKKSYGEYHKLKEDSRELQVARANAEKLLGITNDTQNQDISRKKSRDNSYEK